MDDGAIGNFRCRCSRIASRPDCEGAAGARSLPGFTRRELGEEGALTLLELSPHNRSAFRSRRGKSDEVQFCLPSQWSRNEGVNTLLFARRDEETVGTGCVIYSRREGEGGEGE